MPGILIMPTNLGRMVSMFLLLCLQTTLDANTWLSAPPPVKQTNNFNAGTLRLRGGAPKKELDEDEIFRRAVLGLDQQKKHRQKKPR